MRPFHTYSALLGLMALVACGSPVQQTEQGVLVHIQQTGNAPTAPRLVRLQVVKPNIIHVSATAEQKFADRQSLIIVPQREKTPYDIVQHGDTVSLQTSELHAHVLTSTGEVWFTDTLDHPILQEQQGGGKEFTPYQCTQTHVDGRDETYHGWSIRQVFESPEDEAFYGLGQHQADDWNYKGRNEELFQYNTKVSIPFVVSSRCYGLLFDTYSLCRFGNPKDYSQLHELFNLYDKEGQEGALTGTYTSPEAETLVRREDSLYYENLRSIKNLPEFPLGNAKVVYEGEIEPRETGEYRFIHYYSGYQQIYIDGKPIYTVAKEDSTAQEIWRTAWNPNARKFDMQMEAGHRYPIRITWTPDGGEAYCGLRALAPVSQEEQQKLSMWSEMSQQLDYYFVHGNSMDDVISGYRTLTGKAQIMPRWLMGYWQSRERYKTQREILDALDGFRSRQLPIDNIVMDWNYWVLEDWGAFEFDPERFSDPKGMIDTIHANHAKIMISCWPKYYLTVDNFHELNDKGYIYQQSIRDSLNDWLGFKYAFYDAYEPEARKIFWRQLNEKLGVLGMDAWWMDASEPNVRDCTDMAYRKLLCGPTALGSSDEFFNAYSIVNAEAIYDGQRAYDSQMEDWNQNGFDNEFQPDNRRVFLLTRNGFAGEQRYSTATWSGDIGTRWEDMKAQLSAGLNFCMAGVPFWSQDIGGFSVEKRFEAAQRQFDATGVENADLKEWRELNARWHQWGSFTPMYRSHGQFPYREPWNIAPESHPAYESIRYYLELRYRLMPYYYSLAAQVHFSDYTLMRPLVMDYWSDTEARQVGDQFLCGPALMVNPIFTYGARSRQVYFPQGTWYDFYTGRTASQTAQGERQTVEAPYGRIPLYVPAGAILPVGPAMQWSDEKQAHDIRLYVYRGQSGTFQLYEDENDNYGYEAGRYAIIPMEYDEQAGTLTIGSRQGEFPGMLRERTFTVVPVSPDAPHPFDPEAEGITITYDGSQQQIKL